MVLTSAQKISQSLFFEESFGRLSKLQQLMTVQDMSINEWRNGLYLHCHSLKGSAASFGYTEFAQCCHDLENQLAALPANEVLQTVDCTPILSQIDALRARLTVLSESVEQPAISPPANLQLSQDLTLKGWQIVFKPYRGFFEGGYDPLQILRQLAMLGPMTVTVNTEQLPEFVAMDPEQCYLSWHCQLDAAVPEQVLRNLFDWVKTNCHFELRPINIQRPIEMQTQGIMLQQITALTAQVDKQLTLISQLKQLHAADQSASTPWSDLLLTQLAEINQGLWHDLRKLTMRPLAAAFERLAKQLDDFAHTAGKQIALTLTAVPLETDAQIVDKLADILIQLCRNVAAHGIELPEQRLSAGKNILGCVSICAECSEGMLKITFSDDGAGIDVDKILQAARQKGLIAADETPDEVRLLQFIYHPGMTTANTITPLAGRGVGLDLVRQLMNSIFGHLQINSVRGKGCEFVLQIPLAQILMECQLCQVGDQFYAVPLQSVHSAFQVHATDIHYRSGKGAFVSFEQRWLPVIDLASVFKLPPQAVSPAWLLVVQHEQWLFALQIDTLLDAGQQLIKPTQTHYHTIEAVSGMVLLGQQRLGILLDLKQLVRLCNLSDLASLAKHAIDERKA